MRLCRNLRWKGHAEDHLSAARVREVFEANLVPYSCLQTCGSCGPDGQIVAPELCGGRRRCYEPDVRRLT